jgi:hypothetical protein
MSTMADIPALARKVEDISEDTDVGFILVSRPSQPEQRVFIDVVGRGELAGGQTYIIDEAGAVQETNAYLDGSFAQQWRGALYPLHYGSFGGLAIKVVYALLGVGLCIVVSTGVTIWIARRRERGQPVPGWARIWTSVAWGQVVALSVAAAAAMFNLPALPIWIGAGLLALVSAVVRAPERGFARIWRIAAGVSLLAPVAAHLAVHPWTNALPVLFVHLALIGVGLTLVASAIAAIALPPPQTTQA